MAQVHALLTARMAEKIEKLTELLEQLLDGDEEDVSSIRWRMLRLNQQLANDIEGLETDGVLQQMQEQTEWLIRKSHDYDQQYASVEASLELVGKNMETFHHRMKQLDQRLSSISTGLHALQHHLEQNKSAANAPSPKEPEPSTAITEEAEPAKPIFELKFNIASRVEETPVEPTPMTNEVETPDAPATVVENDLVAEQKTATAEAHNQPTTAPELPEEVMSATETTFIDETPLLLLADELEEAVPEKEEAPLLKADETIESPSYSSPKPAALRVTDFFDPRALTLAERQKADSLKTAITLVEKFQLSKAFFGGDDNAFGKALDYFNNLKTLEEAEQHLAVLAAQYRWDLSDPQLLVLVKAVWRKLGAQ